MKKTTNRTEFIKTLTEEQFNAGCFKLYIPPESKDMCGEGIWGWMAPENKDKYNDDNFYGKLPAILCNAPLNYADKLECFDEIVVKCQGAEKPELDPDFIKEYLM